MSGGRHIDYKPRLSGRAPLIWARPTGLCRPWWHSASYR